MLKRILAGSFLIALFFGGLSVGCGTHDDSVKHTDYGYCSRSGRHMHNDHVFIGDFHDHSLCEWERFK